MGGYNRITNQMKWRTVYVRMGFPNASSSSCSHKMKAAYKKYLHPFEEFHRKHGLAVTMESGRVTSHRPDAARLRHMSGRVKDVRRSRASPSPSSSKVGVVK